MSHSIPDWYKSLQGNPLGETFNDHSAQLIMNRTKQPAKIRNYKMLNISLVSFAFLSILGITLAINGLDFLKSSTKSGGTNFQSYAPEVNGDKQTNLGLDVTQGEQAPINDETEVPVQPDQQGEQMPGTMDISEVPADKIFVPRSVYDPATDSVLKETEIRATDTEDDGLILRTEFTTLNGIEIWFTQASAFKDEEGTIKFVKDAYDQQTVELTQINGHIAAYVDGESRKVVHLITEDHFFTASTSSLNGTIDELKNIMEQIQE
ncbi:hypothetical protein [Paenibacillus sp. LHD-38]|uniref:hypothetical protein n=1 Tax=Paenibacillus sp. LHD-38 TaxID=3072143 RepID=UPI00280CD0CD|nr:hypothetical protein [Paenibacillus sp. LHD-38]MDQ8739490.1 hypothetical protein [Paenibacillus sp. LHD-38]